METRIVVGIIIGISIAAALFVNRSEKYSNLQKVFAWIFIVFPPLQWISILFFTAYNQWHKSKRHENDNSYTYSNSTPQNNKVLILGLLIFLIIGIGIGMFINQSSKNIVNGSQTQFDEIPHEQEEYEITQNDIQHIPDYQPKPTQNTIKYFYIVLKVRKAELESLGPYISGADPIYTVKYVDEYLISDIQQSYNNQDDRYMALDRYKKRVGVSLSLNDNILKSNIERLVKDYTVKEELKKSNSKILSSDIYVYDSYYEASISKEKRERDF